MSTVFGMPGLGGSLGMCALCGDPFIAELLLGQRVPSFKTAGCNQTLFGHAKCLEDFQGKTMLDLPEESPLRQAYEKQEAAAAPTNEVRE